ncbi:MAG TPA: delta-60 repeat domain-containing protein [Syntrophales bacterium]|nr:delta-60 repeat domain-containing protein [Syntrophales bacterium]
MKQLSDCSFRKYCSLSVILVLLLCFVPGANAYVLLDPTFGNEGLVVTDVAGYFDDVDSIAVDDQNRIVAAGSTRNGTNYDFALFRYTASGDLDNTFGNGGIVSIDLSGDLDEATSVAIDADGKIIAAGSAKNNDGYQDFAVVRYLETGEPDLSFGDDGIVTTNILSTDLGESCVIDGNGKIVVAGYAYDGIYGYFGVARYEESGDLDTTFGTDGIVTTDFGRKQDHAYSCAVDSQGRIVVAGIATNPDFRSDFGVARYLDSGDLDNTFGGDGKVTTDIGDEGDHRAYACTVDSEDRVIVAGITHNGGTSFQDNDFAVVRYLENGNLDPAFGDGGIVITDFYGSYDHALSVEIDAEGRIVVAGYSENAQGNNDFAMARYLDNGDLDESFGNGGKVTTDLSNSVDYGHSCAIDSTGRIILAGSSGSPIDERDVFMARYIETDELPSDGGGCNIASISGIAGMLLLPVLFIVARMRK